MVFKLDRLGRSVLHLADLLTRFRNEDIHFCSLSEGINTTTPGGKLVYHIFSAVALDPFIDICGRSSPEYLVFGQNSTPYFPLKTRISPSSAACSSALRSSIDSDLAAYRTASST